MKVLFLFFIAAMLFTGCPTTDTNGEWECPGFYEPKGDRLLGMDILNATETGTFDDNFQKAKEFGGVKIGMMRIFMEEVRTVMIL